MVGYHYTSFEHWEKIQKEGLVPQVVKNLDIYKQIRRNINKDIFGTWVWEKKHRGKAHVGNILRVVAMHDTMHVVLLRLRFLDGDIFRVGKDRAHLFHDGYIGNFAYHNINKHSAWLIKSRVPPDDIKLVGNYNMLGLISIGDMVHWIR